MDEVFLRIAIAAALILGCAGSNGSDAATDANGDAGIDAPNDATTMCPPAVLANDPATPLDYGRAELQRARAMAGVTAAVDLTTADDAVASAALAAARVMLDARAESFAILPAPGGGALIVGRDSTGAMYGALELAERLRLDGAASLPLPAPITSAPSVSIRGANVFAVLPAPGEACWWFRDAMYWREYLDLMAHARMNRLELHGVYSLANTVFPNALLYFANSRTHQDIGIPRADREANLSMLNTIIAMASARGIRVGFMSYRSDFNISGDGPVQTDARNDLYEREAAEDLARRAPGLASLGFRVGESGHDANWYIDTFVAGVLASGARTQVSTRTWHTDGADHKPEVLALSRAVAGNLLIEAKYNGEQLGPPYVVAGADPRQLIGYPSYFYEHYLEPPSPYTFIFQIWASGTHRFFRQASFERIRRITGTLRSLSPRVAGFVLQPSHAYFSQRDESHVNPADRYSPWTFRRDELEYQLFGRLAYDPSTPERVFRETLAARTGTNATIADAMWRAVQAASEIVPWIQTAHSLGADSRHEAVELEWAGSVGRWASPPDTPVERVDPCHPPALGYEPQRSAAYHGPFDDVSLAGPFDAASDHVASRPTVRIRPQDVARLVLDAAAQARREATTVTAPNAEARDVIRQCLALADLGEYAAHKLRAATALAVYAQTASADYLAVARDETRLADDAWAALANDTAWVPPFEDRLRMGDAYCLHPFHWRDQLRLVRLLDPASIDALVAAVTGNPPAFTGTLPPARAWLDTVRNEGPGLTSLRPDPPDATAAQWTVTAEFTRPVPPGATVMMRWKAFPSTAVWQSVVATGSGSRFTAMVPGTGVGAQFAVDVVAGVGNAWRYPDVLQETPYVTLAP